MAPLVLVGAIMSIGIAVTNAILMTAAAMIAGMAPITLGLGEGSEQTAPLGRAVIGGLLGATGATLLVLPAVYALLQRWASSHPASLHPHDPQIRYYVQPAEDSSEQ